MQCRRDRARRDFEYAILYEHTKVIADLEVRVHRTVSKLSWIAQGLLPDPSSLVVEEDGDEEIEAAHKGKRKRPTTATQHTAGAEMLSKAADAEFKGVLDAVRDVLNVVLKAALERYRIQVQVWNVDTVLIEEQDLDIWRQSSMADRQVILRSIFVRAMDRKSFKMLNRSLYERELRRMKALTMDDTVEGLKDRFQSAKTVFRELGTILLVL